MNALFLAVSLLCLTAAQVNSQTTASTGMFNNDFTCFFNIYL